MSNTNGFAVSIKEYAEKRGKTVQAVYQQMKRKENAGRLEGHIVIERVGNKDVKYLDEEAVAILDEASSSTPTVITQEDLKDELTVATNDLKVAQVKLAAQEGQIHMLKELLQEKEKDLRALAAPQERIEALQAQNAEIKGERDEYKGKIADADKRALDANIEAFNARIYAAELEAYIRLPRIVQLFTKKPVLKSREITDAKMGQLHVEEEDRSKDGTEN